MKDYTIYCTPEQTKWSIKLGAQPKIIDSQERVDKNIERIRDTYGIHSYEYKNATYYLVELRYKNSLRVVVVDKVVYNLPTAEQMCGWLEKQGIKITFDLTSAYGPNGLTDGYTPIVNFNWHCETCYVSRKEATLAAIDAALEYLDNNKK